MPVHDILHKSISIHKALASLDIFWIDADTHTWEFQSTRLSRASTPGLDMEPKYSVISIHKALASLDVLPAVLQSPIHSIPIHKALASLDANHSSSQSISIRNFNPQGSREPRQNWGSLSDWNFSNFNPQGSREPRPISAGCGRTGGKISIHKALASLDLMGAATHAAKTLIFQSTRLSRASTCGRLDGQYSTSISIHKALASLDGSA